MSLRHCIQPRVFDNSNNNIIYEYILLLASIVILLMVGLHHKSVVGVNLPAVLGLGVELWTPVVDIIVVGAIVVEDD